MPKCKEPELTPAKYATEAELKAELRKLGWTDPVAAVKASWETAKEGMNICERPKSGTRVLRIPVILKIMPNLPDINFHTTNPLIFVEAIGEYGRLDGREAVKWKGRIPGVSGSEVEFGAYLVT